MPTKLDHIFYEDCRVGLKDLADASADMCLTDSPYGYDVLGSDWNADRIAARASATTGVVKSISPGMRFDSMQGRKHQAFLAPICREIYRVLKPGAYFMTFAAPRLYHRTAVAMEEAGFEIRDMICWTHEGGQAKAFGQDHIIRKSKRFSDREKAGLITALNGWKTPQLKPCFEPIVLAQKPIEGTFVQNWAEYGVGLMNTTVRVNQEYPANIIRMPKPSRSEKGVGNTHPTVKPVQLCEYLIALFTQPGALVIEPFLGSGTTAIAALNTGRYIVGYEKDRGYSSIIETRLGAARVQRGKAPAKASG